MFVAHSPPTGGYPTGTPEIRYNVLVSGWVPPGNEVATRRVE